MVGQHDARASERSLLPWGRGSAVNTSSPAPPSAARGEGLDEGLLVDDGAARDVDEGRVALHEAQLARAHEAARLGLEREVDRDPVRDARRLRRRRAGRTETPRAAAAAPTASLDALAR